MLIMALLAVAMLVGIVASMLALDAMLGEHEVPEDCARQASPSFVTRLRERVVLRWDTTRRLR